MAVKRKKEQQEMHEPYSQYELMQMVLQQYRDFADQKTKLENKALGYITPLSIMIVASVAIIIIAAQAPGKSISNLPFIFFLWGQIYFCAWTFFVALRVYTINIREYPGIKKYAGENWRAKIDDLNNKLEKMADCTACCRIFMFFSMSFSILNMCYFIVYLLRMYS